MRRQRNLALLMLAALSGGCGQAGTGAGAPSRRGADVITATEIEASSAPNAYELIAALRPSWLRQRATGVESGGERVQVYLDRMPIGQLDSLREIGLAAVTLLEHLDGLTATQRLGTDHGGGAILIFTEHR